ncbi:hypothetical protein C8R43DRAFT_454327 [Mycena crocata]|nr:hypothetical protein C8R43DRAFT_454327 [Mycena crocata]
MTQNTLPVHVAGPVPHYLVNEVLDKSVGNWPTWEKSILSCLALVGLEGHPLGAVPYPHPEIDHQGALNWHANDRAVVTFLTSKASPTEQTYIASHAVAGSKTVWDALLARHGHVGTGAQVRLIREAFSVRYGAEPPAQTSARIDALATRIFALGPISRATLLSAIMVNAVQGDLENFSAHQPRASSSKEPPPHNVDRMSTQEQAAISAITAELSMLQHTLSPAVLAFCSSTQGSSEAEWTRLLEALFQVLHRLDAINVAPEWSRAQAMLNKAKEEVVQLQNTLQDSPTTTPPAPPPPPVPPRISEAEQTAMAAIATELSNVQRELAPVVAEYLQGAPDETQRNHLIQVLFQSLRVLDQTAMQPEWAEGKIKRRRAVEEVLRLLNTLEWSADSNAEAKPNSGPAEQDMISVIAAELTNVQNVLAPAVATFPRPADPPTDKERKQLSQLLFQTIERLDATHLNLDWEEARNHRRHVVKTVQNLQTTLDALPSCIEEQTAIAIIEDERSKIQFLLFPAVSACNISTPNEKERVRLGELSFQALERLDAVILEKPWEQARKARWNAVTEVQKLQDNLAPPPPPVKKQEQRDSLHLVKAQRSKIKCLYSSAVRFYLEKPSDRERARLDKLLAQTLESLDDIYVEQGWEEVVEEKRSAVKEVQDLQMRMECPPPAPEPSGEHTAITAIAAEWTKIHNELSPAVMLYVRTYQPSTLPNGAAGQVSNDKERGRLNEFSLQLLEHLDAVAIEPGWEQARQERRSAVKQIQKLQDMLDVWA